MRNDIIIFDIVRQKRGRLKKSAPLLSFIFVVKSVSLFLRETSCLFESFFCLYYRSKKISLNLVIMYLLSIYIVF